MIAVYVRAGADRARHGKVPLNGEGNGRAKQGKQAGKSAEAPDSLALARSGIGSRLQA
jgi:hypothetical protein